MHKDIGENDGCSNELFFAWILVFIYLTMDSKKYEQYMKLFLNEPGLLKHYLQRNNPLLVKAEKFKTIFPPSSQLERFRHLEHARTSAQRDLELDTWVCKLIKDFEEKVHQNSRADRDIEHKKDVCLGKLKMDYVEEQMSEHLQELEKLIKDYDYYSQLIGSEKDYVQRMIMMTEIKKALVIQNNILKKENEVLKNQEEEIDVLINRKKK